MGCKVTRGVRDQGLKGAPGRLSIALIKILAEPLYDNVINNLLRSREFVVYDLSKLITVPMSEVCKRLNRRDDLDGMTLALR